jgi:hypothetical protein
LIYTSFGVLVGIITPVLVTIECINLYRKRQARHLLISLGVLALSLLSSGSFFIGYRFLSGMDNFQFPHPQFWNYPRFMALAFAHFLEVKGIGFFPLLIGLTVFLTVIVIGGLHFKQLFGDKKPNRDVSLVVATLLTFSVLFCANMAVGRISLGPWAAQSPRYTIFLVPAYLCLYFHLLTLRRSTKKRLAGRYCYRIGCSIFSVERGR